MYFIISDPGCLTAQQVQQSTYNSQLSAVIWEPSANSCPLTVDCCPLPVALVKRSNNLLLSDRSALLQNLGEYPADGAAWCLNSKQRSERGSDIVDGDVLTESSGFDLRPEENDGHMRVIPVRGAVRRPRCLGQIV